jgi:hypothetical protein
MRPDGWTDMTKLIVTFRNFANALENSRSYDPLLLYDIMVCEKIDYAVTTVLRAWWLPLAHRKHDPGNCNSAERIFFFFNLLRLHILPRCATSRAVPGSIPGVVTGFFSDISPSDRSMALGSTQPLLKMSTRNIPGGKGGRCVRLPNSPAPRAECHEIWEPKPSGPHWACNGNSLPLPYISYLASVASLLYRPIRTDKMQCYC